MQISEYIDQVCNQMRWKKARTRVAEELTAHITDSRDAYIAQGYSEAAATQAAISDTGDASALGTGFDRVHRPRPQWGMFAAVAGFLVLGLLSSIFVHDVGLLSDRFPHSVGLTSVRLAWMAVGIVLMFAAYFVDFSIFGKYPWAIFVSMLVIIGLVVITFSIGAYTPFIGLILPLALTIFVFKMKSKGMLGVALSTAIHSVICIFATDLGMSMFYHVLIAGFAVLIVAHIKGWFGAGKIVGALPMVISFAGIAALGLMRTGTNRISTAFNPTQDMLGFGFMGTQVRHLLRGASLLGEGTHTIQFIPPWDLHSDLLLATVIHRFGWIPFAIIICAIAAFIVVGFKRCLKQKSHLGLFVSFAIMVTFTVQVVMYVVYNLGFLFTVISLPFISPGNSAMVVNLILVGFMLSVFRTGDAVQDKDFLPAKV